MFATQLRLDGRPMAGSRYGSQVRSLLGDASSIQDDVRGMPAILVEDLEAPDHWEIAPDPPSGRRTRGGHSWRFTSMSGSSCISATAARFT